MATKQLNKNVIGALTVTAIVLSVGAVGVASYAAGKKDPALLAQKAAESETKGDFKRAKELYGRAFTAGKDANFLIEASRCAYEEGEFSEALHYLQVAEAQSPGNPKPLIALLERYWEIRILGWQGWTELRGAAEKLLEIEPENMLGLVCLADALDATKDQDPANPDKLAKTLEKARSIDATDPRLAIVEASAEIRKGIDAIRHTPNLSLEQQKQLIQDSRIAAAAVLQKSLAKNPKDERVIDNLAEVLRATDRADEGLAVLEKGAQENPNAPEIRQLLAQHLVFKLATSKKDAPPEERKPLVDTALQHVEKAIELDKAMFEAYATRAELLQLQASLDGTWDSDRAARQKRILETFVKAQDDTLKLKSLRAMAGTQQKAMMIASGFDFARRFFTQARPANPDERKVALEYAQRFLDDTKRQYPESVYRSLMEAWLAQVDNDTTAAIQAYTRAEERAGTANTAQRRQIKEQLGLLTMRDAPGRALRYVDDAIALYREIGLPMPQRMASAKAQLLNALDRPKDTITFIDAVRAFYPNDFELESLYARAQAMLGNTERGSQLAEKQEGPRARLEQARIEAVRGEFASAFAKVREFLLEQPTDDGALRLMVTIANRDTLRADGLKLITELEPKTTDESRKRSLELIKLVLLDLSPDERHAKTLEIMSKIPDACERNSQTLNYLLARREFAKAYELVPELLKCRGEADENALRVAFDLDLANGKLDVAEQRMLKLTKANADRAGGATFRGQLKVAKNDIPGALAEYRAAERDLPTAASLKVQIADLLRRSNPPQLDEALETLKQGLELDPRDFEINRMAYVVYEQLGRGAEGIEHLATAAAVNPNDPFVKERVRLVDEAKDPAKGIAWREPLRKERPDDIENLVRLAELYNKSNEPEKADECIAAAVAAGPTVLQVVQVAARHYSERKNREAGEKLVRQFVASATGGAKLEGQVILGKFFESIGDAAAAAAAYQEGERRVDEWLKDDAAMRARGKVVLQMALADFYARQNQLPAVIDAYRTALASVRPEMAAATQELRVKLIRALLANQQFGEGEKEIDSYRRDYAKDIRGNTLKAEAILRQRSDKASLDEAREYLNRTLAEKPDESWSLYARARIAVAQRRFKDAQDDLMHLKSIDRKAFQYESRAELARVLESSGSLQLAEAELRQIVDERGGDNESAMALIAFFIRTDESRKAEAYCNERIAKAADDPYWYYQLGRLMAKRGEHASAIQPLGKALELTRGRNLLVLEEWINAMTAAGRERDVISAAQKLPPESATPKVMVAIAAAHSRLKQTKEAADLVTRALEGIAGEALEEVDIIARRASSFLPESTLTTCIQDAEKKFASQPDASARLRLEVVRARGLIQLQNPDALKQAEKIADDVIAAAPARLRPLHAAARHTKALTHDFSGDYNEALKQYEQAVQNTPDDPTLLNNVAFLLSDKLDRPADALPYIERSARIAPQNPNFLDTLGYVHYRNNDLARAETALREALRLDSKSLAANYHLALVLIKDKRGGEARALLQRVMDQTESNKTDPYRKKAEDELKKPGN
jgi:tetratricopeptide (TPR) repeat protein